MNVTDADKSIRRYLSVPQFFSLFTEEVENRGKLYFPSTAEFEKDDPYEGFFPRLDEYQKWYTETIVKPNIRKILDECKKNYEKEGETDYTKIQTILNSLSEWKPLYIQDNHDKIQLAKIIFHHLCNPKICTENYAIKQITNILVNNKDILNLKDRVLKKSLISCWNSNSYEIETDTSSEFSESDGMWKLYAKQDGIMIESTVAKAKEFLDFTKVKDNYYIVDFNEITYFSNEKYQELFEELNKFPNNGDIQDKWISDFVERLEPDPKEKPPFPLYKLLFCKRTCFEHEKEYRIVVSPNIWKKGFDESKEIDKFITITDLNGFIDKIIISPYAPNYYKAMITTSLNKIAPNLVEKVHDSDIKKSNKKLKTL